MPVSRTHPVLVPVSGDDTERLRAWYAVESSSLAADRPEATQRSLSALTSMLRHPSPRRHVELWAAVVGGQAVGAAEVSWTLADNLHLAECELHVRPDARRRGVGGALLAQVDAVRRAAGRTTLLGEVHTPLDREGAGLRFARRAGFASVHREEHLVLALPAAPGPHPPGADDADGISLVVWGDRCPDAHLAGFATMQSRMQQDLPVGEVDWQPPAVVGSDVRRSEDRLRADYETVVAAAVTSAGGYAGYSVVYLPREGDHALQDDTLVMPEHRGRGVGRRLKLATLDVLAREHPARIRLHTYTDPDNHAMYRTNLRFGYRPVEVMHEMQRIDPAAPGV